MALLQMDQIAALVEEASAVAQSLEVQGKALSEVIAAFRLASEQIQWKRAACAPPFSFHRRLRLLGLHDCPLQALNRTVRQKDVRVDDAVAEIFDVHHVLPGAA